MPRVAKGRRPQRQVCADGMALFTAMSVHFMSHQCSAKSEVTSTIIGAYMDSLSDLQFESIINTLRGRRNS